MSEFYVYMWFRTGGTPCYVGKGQGDRWRRRWGRNPHLRRLLALHGDRMPCVIVREGLTEAEAFEAERALIQTIGREPHGPLVNLTDGGDGPSGLQHNETTKTIVGAASRRMWTDPEKRAAIIAAENRGRATEEYRHKRSLISKEIASRPEVQQAVRTKAVERMNDPVERKRTAEATRAAMARPDIKAKASAGQKRRFVRPEERERLAQLCKGTTLSPEHRRKIGEAHKGQKRSAEARAKMSAWQVGRKMSPEARAKMSAAAKRRASTPQGRERL